MYFDNLPETFHTLGGHVEAGKLVRNIMVSVGMRRDVEERYLLQEIRIEDGETPESVAHRYYGHSKWWWVVVLSSGKKKREDWPRSSRALREEIDRLHGTRADQEVVFVGTHSPSERVRTTFVSDGVTITHHEDGSGLDSEENGVIKFRGQFLTPRNLAVEANEKKRTVRILDRNHLSDFVTEFKRTVKQ